MLFIEYYIILITALLLFFIVGWGLYRAYFYFLFDISNDKPVSICSNITLEITLIGMLITTFIYAIIACRGMTLQLPSLFLLLWFVYLRTKTYSEQNMDIPYRSIKSKLSEFIILITIIYTLVFLFSYDFNNGLLDLYFDNYYYAKMSEALLDIGIENVHSNNYPFVIVDKPSLYHFGHIWINGVLSFIFKGNVVYTFRLVLSPILIYFCLNFTRLLVSYILPSQRLLVIYIITILGLLGTAIVPLLHEDLRLIPLTYGYEGLPLISNWLDKILIVWVLFAWAVYTYITLKDIVLFFIIISLAILSYNTLLPSYLGGLFLMGGGYVYKSYLKDRVIFTKNSFKLLFIGLYLLFIFGSMFLFLPSVISGKVNSAFLTAKTFLILFGENILRPWTSYIFLPLFMMFLPLKYYSDEKKYLLLYVIGMLFAGGAFMVFNQGGEDVRQVLQNASPPVFTLMTILFLSYLIKYKTKARYVLFLMCLVFFTNSMFILFNKPRFSECHYSQGYVTKVLSELSKNKMGIAASYSNQDDYISGKWYYRYNAAGTVFYYAPNSNYLFELSHYWHPKYLSDSLINITRKDPLYNKLSSMRTAIQRDSVIVSFLEEKKVDYMFVEDIDLLPICLKEISSPIVTDSFATGETLLRLNFSKS